MITANEMMHEAVQRMHNRTEEFLPEALTEDDEVHVMFLFTDIDKEISKNDPAEPSMPTLDQTYTPPSCRFETGKITPAELWNDREKWFDKAKDSRARWNALNDNRRDEIKEHTRDTLTWLYHNEGWEPEVAVKGGNFVSIYFPA